MRLIESLATTEPLAELFADESVLRAMLEFEVALARAEARVGVIHRKAAEAIALAAQPAEFNLADLARATLRAGTPGIPLVRALTERVRGVDPDAAGYVHWGTTSQDVVDTALVLLLARARPLLEAEQLRMARSLERLSAEHSGTVMLGRTLLQPAPPVTFGLKAAGWLAASRRGWNRVADAFDELRILQFGGASGTLAALDDRGLEVGRALAEELGLHFPDAPWHTHRDRLAALVAACGIYAGSLGKMARDISLLAQAEVGELSEGAGAGRGGSSTMPQKRNPIGCTVALASANRLPGLVASVLTGMVQEHERGVGGWQAEWLSVTGAVQAAGVAVAALAEVAGELEVDPDRMRRNLDATLGTAWAEHATMLLGERLGRDAAHRLLQQATRTAIDSGRPLADVLAELPEIDGVLSASQLQRLESADDYLGVAEALRQRLLASGRDELRREEP